MTKGSEELLRIIFSNMQETITVFPPWQISSRCSTVRTRLTNGRIRKATAGILRRMVHVIPFHKDHLLDPQRPQHSIIFPKSGSNPLIFNF